MSATDRKGPGRFGRLDEERRARITALASQGEPVAVIAKRLGIDRDTARRWIDPDYRERRNRQVAETRSHGGTGPKWDRNMKALRADVAARRAEVPPDTRGLTARLFGDPIPGDTRDRRGIIA